MKHTRLSITFFALGVLCIVSALGLFFYNRFTADKAYEVSQDTVSQLTELIEQEEPGIFPTDNVEREMPKTKVDGNGYIGYLNITEYDLKLPVSAEINYDILNISPCLYSGSVYSNDMVVAAHNYEYHFGKIPYLPIGSVITFTDVENNKYEYQVISIETLGPTQIEEMTTKTIGNNWDLTLFTCNYGGSQRIAVRCMRTAES